MPDLEPFLVDVEIAQTPEFEEQRSPQTGDDVVDHAVAEALAIVYEQFGKLSEHLDKRNATVASLIRKITDRQKDIEAIVNGGLDFGDPDSTTPSGNLRTSFADITVPYYGASSSGGFYVRHGMRPLQGNAAWSGPVGFFVLINSGHPYGIELTDTVVCSGIGVPDYSPVAGAGGGYDRAISVGAAPIVASQVDGLWTGGGPPANGWSNNLVQVGDKFACENYYDSHNVNDVADFGSPNLNQVVITGGGNIFSLEGLTVDPIGWYIVANASTDTNWRTIVDVDSTGTIVTVDPPYVAPILAHTDWSVLAHDPGWLRIDQITAGTPERLTLSGPTVVPTGTGGGTGTGTWGANPFYTIRRPPGPEWAWVRTSNRQVVLPFRARLMFVG